MSVTALNIVMLSVIVLSAIVLNIIALNIIMLSVIMLSVIILSVTAPYHLKQRNQNRRYRLNCFKTYFCLFLVTLPHQLTVLSFRCQNNDFKRHIWLQPFCPNAIYPNDTFMRLRQRGGAPNPLALAIKVTEVSSYP